MRQSSRLHIILFLCLAALIPITSRLVYLQTVRSDAFIKRIAHSTERRALEIIPRGRILDRRGRILAQSVPAWSSFLDLKVLAREPRKREETLDAIAKALSLNGRVLRKKLVTKRRTVWLKRKMTLVELEQLKKLKYPAVGIHPDERRYYPNENLARSVLGFVSSDGRGLAGLEYAFDRALSGKAIQVRQTRDGVGRRIADSNTASRRAPQDLVLSLDRTVQYFAEQALNEGIRKTRAQAGFAIVQDPQSGEILAMAERTADVRRIAAIQDVFEPGSTFKIVIAAAAIEAGHIAPNELINCENGRWEVTPGVRIKDHEKRGMLTLQQIIQYSSNIGTAKLGLKLGSEKFLEYCRRFGFGYKTGTPLAGESAGIVPKKKMRDVRLANAAFGQGIAVNALQLIGAYSAIANGGMLLEPRLVLRAHGRKQRGRVEIRRIARPDTVRKLTTFLERVVEAGTGATAAIPGYSTAGKTGTAEKIDPSTRKYSTTDYVASFAGFVPARNPRFTILVVIDTPRVGEYGSEVAAPIFAQIARQLLAHFAIAPDLPLPLRWDEEKKKIKDAPKPPPSTIRLPRPSFLKSPGGVGGKA
ncbi:MAG: hypothetical protein COB53_06900 [Elusimicrobia bacterium]|nr:MAG: hypothetical protein COB53_06900 [Elusimicrobiota bacterium]